MQEDLFKQFSLGKRRKEKQKGTAGLARPSAAVHIHF